MSEYGIDKELFRFTVSELNEMELDALEELPSDTDITDFDKDIWEGVWTTEMSDWLNNVPADALGIKEVQRFVDWTPFEVYEFLRVHIDQYNFNVDNGWTQLNRQKRELERKQYIH